MTLKQVAMEGPEEMRRMMEKMTMTMQMIQMKMTTTMMMKISPLKKGMRVIKRMTLKQVVMEELKVLRRKTMTTTTTMEMRTTTMTMKRMKMTRTKMMTRKHSNHQLREESENVDCFFPFSVISVSLPLCVWSLK